ncbi:MAG: PIN domain nuclease, partial [Thermodesulfatator sp.]
MTGVDTNIIIRLLTQDDPGQAYRARKVFADKEIFMADTVLLET